MISVSAHGLACDENDKTIHIFASCREVVRFSNDKLRELDEIDIADTLQEHKRALEKISNTNMLKSLSMEKKIISLSISHSICRL